MLYGVKCTKCGLIQLPKPACKACGAALEAPAEAPPRASSRPLSKAPPRSLPKTSLQELSNTPLEAPGAPIRMTLDIPSEDFLHVPSDAPSDGRASRTAKNCSECGLVYFEDELIRFGDAWVCGKCKPVFVQKLREGVAPAGELVHAGFWIRVGAKIIDMIILWAVGFAVSFLGGFLFAGVPSSRGQIPTRFLAGSLLIAMMTWVIQIAYPTYFLGKYSATLGKMACGLKVVRPDGEKISYARACGRFFAEILSSMILAIGYIMVALDEEKRALHDRICDTRVIKA